MIIDKPTAKTRELPNKYLYAVFVLTSIYFLFVKDHSTALSLAGLALIFDPFNTCTLYHQRPLWQRVWLIVHLVFVLVLFVVTVIK